MGFHLMDNCKQLYMRKSESIPLLLISTLLYFCTPFFLYYMVGMDLYYIGTMVLPISIFMTSVSLNDFIENKTNSKYTSTDFCSTLWLFERAYFEIFIHFEDVPVESFQEYICTSSRKQHTQHYRFYYKNIKNIFWCVEDACFVFIYDNSSYIKKCPFHSDIYRELLQVFPYSFFCSASVKEKLLRTISLHCPVEVTQKSVREIVSALHK